MIRSLASNSNIFRRDDRETEEGYGCCGGALVFLAYCFTILLFPITIWGAFKVIQEYERAVIFRLGRVKVLTIFIYKIFTKKN